MSSDESDQEMTLRGENPQTNTEVMMDHQLSSGNVFVHVMTGAMQEAEQGTAKKDKKCTPNIRALAVSAFLFTLITVAQVFAAIKANSKALMVDCISMGVDAFTYMGNIIVECRKRKPGKHVISQLIIVACSLGLLCYFTQDALQGSWATMKECKVKRTTTTAAPSIGEASLPPEEEDGEEVNGWITLVFALGGVAFDLMCMMEFYKSNQRQESIKAVNMFSAFLHVGADFLRSTSTTIMSLIILIGNQDSTCVDATTSLIIGATIIAGAFLGFWKWIKMLLGCIFGWERNETTVG
jgi:divalent metal cation (Fe/Co/Zn/Cd) transporter